MSDKLKAADAMAKAVRESWNAADHENFWEKFQVVVEALAAYEAASAEEQPAESQAAGDWIVRAAKEFQVHTPAKDCTTDKLIEIITHFYQHQRKGGSDMRTAKDI